MPKISVIISAYNHEKFITKALESVLAQSFTDFEILIIDDNSLDNTANKIKQFNDARIIFHKNHKNHGMSLNTNLMLKQAQGEYIAILNSDDYWHQDKLQKQLDFLERNPNYGACLSLAEIVDENNKIITNAKNNPFKALDLQANQMIREFFYHSNFLCYPSALIRKQLFLDIQGLNCAYLILLDADLWLKILCHGKNIKILPEKLTFFRILDNEKNLSADNPAKIISYDLENTRICQNFTKIKNYQDFVAIFPEYKEIALANKNLEGYFYLIDLCFKKIFFQNTKEHKNIRNFIIEFIHQKTATDPDFFVKLQQELKIDYNQYRAMIIQYPNGQNILRVKNQERKFTFTIITFTFILIIILAALIFS